MNFQLKRLRKEYKPKSLTQSDLAKVIQVSDATYIRKENGVTPFTEYEILLISDYFDKSPTDIFFQK